MNLSYIRLHYWRLLRLRTDCTRVLFAWANLLTRTIATLNRILWSRLDHTVDVPSFLKSFFNFVNSNLSVNNIGLLALLWVLLSFILEMICFNIALYFVYLVILTSINILRMLYLILMICTSIRYRSTVYNLWLNLFLLLTLFTYLWWLLSDD